MRERPTVQDRIDSRTDRTPGCWLWTGAADQHGYGVIKVDGAMRRVTRVVWSDAHGAIPDGLSVLHACDNPPCIRPDHLMLGTQRANVRDALNKRRRPQNERAA